LPRVDRHKAVIILALLLVAATPALGQPYLTRFATGVLIFGLVAMSLDLLVGYGGMVSFGHAAFFGLVPMLLPSSVFMAFIPLLLRSRSPLELQR
jgi:branched-chain amino acid transport system permease protein